MKLSMRSHVWVFFAVVLFAVSCSGSAERVVTQAPSGTLGTADPCVAAAAFVDVMGNLGITYDYDPTGAPMELADLAAVVVRGELISVTELPEAVEPSGPYLVFNLAISEALGQSAIEDDADTVKFRVGFNAAERPFAEVAAAFTPGIDALLFLGDEVPTGGRVTHLEGFWVGCGDGSTAASVIVEPALWDSPGDLNDLADSVAADVGGRLPEGPPPVRISSGGQSLELAAISYCWAYEDGRGECADGVPPNPLPSLGLSTEPIVIEFAEDGWTFKASLASGANDSTTERVLQHKVDENTWQIEVPGMAGVYQLDVSGRGPQGDVAVRFEFEVPDPGAAD